jgi:ABC-type anion transport system duplicated permease subunit
VVIAATNYASLSLVDITFRAIHPVFLATPVEMGGLGLAPPTIGKLLSVLGILNGILQVCFFAKIHDRWGSKRVFIGGLMSSFPAFALFPVINTLARKQGYSPAVWIAVGAQIGVFIILNVSYGAWS